MPLASLTSVANSPVIRRRTSSFGSRTFLSLSKFRVTGYSPMAVAFAPDGALAAVADTNGTVHLVDPKTGAGKHMLLGRTRVGRGVTFSPDGATVGATGDDGTVQRWKVADGSRLSTTEPPVGNLYGARVRLVSAEKGVAWSVRGSAAPSAWGFRASS